MARRRLHVRLLITTMKTHTLGDLSVQGSLKYSFISPKQDAKQCILVTSKSSQEWHQHDHPIDPGSCQCDPA